MNPFLAYIKQNFQADAGRKWLWLPVLFGAGIGFYFALPVEPSKWITLGVIEGLILLAVIGRYHPRFLSFLIIPAMITAGFAYIQIRSHYLASQSSPAVNDQLYVTGKVQEAGFTSSGRRRLVLDQMRDFDGREIPGRYRISYQMRQKNIRPGQCVEMAARLRPLPRAVIPGGYQFDRKLFFEGLTGSGYALSRVLPVDCDHEPASFSSASAAHDWRENIIRRVRHILPGQEGAVASAIIAGGQGQIKTSLLNRYRDSGLAHFLSISGLHMSMIAGLMFFLVRLIIALIPPLALRCDSRRVAAWFAILIGVFYLLLSGAAVPAQRAFIMTFIVLLGVLTNRRAISMQTIAVAAFLVLLISPQALIGASFQMSFAAVVALIAFYEKFSRRLHFFINGGEADPHALGGRILRIAAAYFIGIIVTDLIASLATLPLAIYHFNRVAVFTSLTNFLAGPLIGFVVMPFTLLSLLLMPLGLETPALHLVGWGLRLINQIISFVSDLPHAALPVLSMPFWGFLLIILGGLWLTLWTARWRWWGLIAVAVGFASLLWADKPDFLISADAQAVAVKDQRGDLLILPTGRGARFVKSVWRSKMAMPKLSPARQKRLKAIWRGEETGGDWLSLHCDKHECLYHNRIKFGPNGLWVDGRPVDFQSGEGAAVYLTDPAQIISVRDSIGHRFWNRD